MRRKLCYDDDVVKNDDDDDLFTRRKTCTKAGEELAVLG